MVRILAPGLILAAAFVALPGCTYLQGTYPGNRLKDALDMVDLGVTVTSTSQTSFYMASLSLITLGSGQVEGRYYGIGGGDLGSMKIWYSHCGEVVEGREEVGWGDGWLWRFGGYDLSNPETLDCQNVGFAAINEPPFDARPSGRPT